MHSEVVCKTTLCCKALNRCCCTLPHPAHMATRVVTGGRAGGLLGEGSTATLTRATGGRGCPPTHSYCGHGLIKMNVFSTDSWEVLDQCIMLINKGQPKSGFTLSSCDSKFQWNKWHSWQIHSLYLRKSKSFSTAMLLSIHFKLVIMKFCIGRAFINFICRWFIHEHAERYN